MPSPKMLTFLLTFIFATVFAAMAKPLGTAPATIAGFFGAAVGWVGSRYLMRKLF